jgi:hypothetical protein
MGADVLAEAAELEQKIADGTLKVPGLDVLGVPGSGDEVDPTSLG